MKRLSDPNERTAIKKVVIGLTLGAAALGLTACGDGGDGAPPPPAPGEEGAPPDPPATPTE
jgi:hypothetical protein